MLAHFDIYLFIHSTTFSKLSEDIPPFSILAPLGIKLYHLIVLPCILGTILINKWDLAVPVKISDHLLLNHEENDSTDTCRYGAIGKSDSRYAHS